MSSDPLTIRHEILKLAADNDATASYLEDVQIAETLAQPLGTTQTQIRILEDDGLIEAITEFGPKYAIKIRPAGLKYLESSE
jgi:hypothetical protein